MKGHVREVRPGVWQVSWDLPPDPLTGRRRRRAVTVRGDAAEAERQRAILLGQASQGIQEPGQITVRGLADEWLGLIAGTVRPSTLQSYREKIGLACRWVGDRRVRDLGPRQLTDLYRRIPRSPQTVVHVHRVLHRMFADGQRWGLLPSNPAAGAVPPRVERRRLQVWNAGQAAEFLQRTRDHPLGPLFRLALTTGMRRGELLGLRWPAVDLQRGRVIVQEATVMVAGHPTVSGPKTAAGRRLVALDAETVRQLEHLRQRQQTDREWFADTYRGDWVFCWPDGRQLSPDWVSRQFKGLSWGLPPIRFHDLRHTWATLALEAGVPAKVVSDRLGHAGIAITLDTYTHHVESLDRQAAEQVAQLFASGSPGGGFSGTTPTRGLPDGPPTAGNPPPVAGG